MPARPARPGLSNPGEPVAHELPPTRYGSDSIPTWLIVRREEDGTWRGRLVFGDNLEASPSTAEILFGKSESELWQAVMNLRAYHLSDLYRSVSE